MFNLGKFFNYFTSHYKLLFFFIALTNVTLHIIVIKGKRSLEEILQGIKPHISKKKTNTKFTKYNQKFEGGHLGADE